MTGAPWEAEAVKRRHILLLSCSVPAHAFVVEAPTLRSPEPARFPCSISHQDAPSGRCRRPEGRRGPGRTADGQVGRCPPPAS
jgi:hypothetical protein